MQSFGSWGILFLGLFYKSANICFYCEYTNEIQIYNSVWNEVMKNILFYVNIGMRVKYAYIKGK